jgi:ubiquinone/menaquinone biosynthesis C-methylase UbiE
MMNAATLSTSDPAVRYQQARIGHWDNIARRSETWHGWGGYYHRRLAEVYRFWVAPGQRVLELGCAQGDLLAALQPSNGVGIDFSAEMIHRARQRHPDLRFIQVDAHDFELDETFDVIILSDLLNDAWDVQSILERVARVAEPHTRLLINTYSRLWEPALGLAERLNLATPVLHQNWLTVHDVKGLLSLAGFETIRQWQEVLWTFDTPVLRGFFNRVLAHVWPIRHLDLTNFILARPKPFGLTQRELPSVSVIVPARNEAGNIPQIFERVPRLGRETELVFVEGHSRDNTYAAIEQALTSHPDWKCQLWRQIGVGKGDAVREGFTHATGEILMILDADLTMPPEDLPRYYQVLRSGQGEFANGVRLIYPMEGEAMRFLNLVGNRFFSAAFSWLLGQPVKDTLCGTKVLWKRDYDLIAANRAYFGDFDPFGDFDLLFGATKLNLKIVDLPIRYRERTYGATNIHRWKHGWLLLKMVWFALWRLKFV